MYFHSTHPTFLNVKQIYFDHNIEVVFYLLEMNNKTNPTASKSKKLKLFNN